MRAYFSNDDLRKLIADVYEESTIAVDLVDADTGERTESDFASYLDIDFYSWWTHPETMAEVLQDEGGDLKDAWKKSLNWSLGKSYALVEQTDEETISSQDISGATIFGRCTFLINSSKITEAEKYFRYLKSKYTGKRITRETSDGSTVVGYLSLGIFLYDQEPQLSQLGEIIVASMNFKFNYLALAGTYDSVKLAISLDGNTDAYYKDMPMIKYTWQNIFTKESVPTANRADIAGFIVTAISQSITISFYDFDNALVNDINAIFWRLGAFSIDGTTQTTQVVNIPIWLKATIGTKVYKYRCVLTDMQKVFANNEFTISSITLNGWGK